MSALLDIVASYVPASVARRRAIDPTPPEAPELEHRRGAVLFADISGFTALAERLARRGPAGAEELSRLLNACFGELIELVASHGGEVVEFVGDALLALWTEDEDLPTLTLRAAQCALAFGPTLGRLAATEGVRLSMHIGVGAGVVSEIHVGGVFGRWELLLTGEPTAQMASAMRRAEPGEVVLSREAWELVRASCEGWPLEDGHARLESVRDPLPLRPAAPPECAPEMEDALLPYVPGAVRARLRAGQLEWLAELRLVTVLFVGLEGLDEATPLERWQEVMRLVQTTLYRYEGSVNKLIVDDKGTTLIAALGLPPLAHEDDPVRGVLAAREMRAALGEVGMRCPVGVATGRAFCGSVGNERRREYTMIGDMVNLAARLMQAASGDVLCDAATYRAARERFAFEEIPGIDLKGRIDPIPAYRPLGTARLATRSRGTLVGRSEERRRLASLIEGLLRDEEGGTGVIEGEPGVGKSLLVDDLTERAREEGVSVLVGGGDAVERSAPYHAWRPVFAQLFGVEENLEPEERRARALPRLEGLLGAPESLERAPLLNAVLPLELPESEITEQMSGQVRADNTNELLVRLLRAAASRSPTLLVLDDAQWLDSASWALAELAAERVRPLVLVIASRPPGEEPPAVYRRLLRSPGVRRIQLGMLPGEEALELVCGRLGVASLPEPVRDLILEKAEGHPFFSEELGLALRDAGLLAIEDGQCSLASGVDSLSTLSLPGTVEGAITSRIDRLPAAQQLALKVASVVGRIFAFRTLRDIHPVDADRLELAEHLATLQRLDFTRLEAPEPELTYIFKHATTREVAYNLMLYAQRRELHRATAEWYERSHAEDLSSFYPLLAHHWGQAGVAHKAIDYLEKSGEQALTGGAYREAVGFFVEALALDAREEPGGSRLLRRLRWERQLGEAHLGLGNLAESREHLERALSILGRPTPRTPVSLVSGLASQLLRQVGNRLGRDGGRRAASPEDRENLLEAARAYEQLAHIHYLDDETAAAVHTALSTLNLSEAVGPTPELARAYASVCVAAGMVGLHPLARLYGRRALEIIERLPDLRLSAIVLEATGLYHYGAGQLEEARRALGRSAEICEQIGDRRTQDESAALLASVSCARGEFAEGARLGAEVHARALDRKDAQAQSWGLTGRGMNLLAIGEVDEAARLFETAAALGEQLNSVDNLLVNGHLGRAYLHRGELRSAGEAAARAARSATRLGSSTHADLIWAYAGLAEVYLALWERGNREMASPARSACRALRQHARTFPVGNSMALRWGGLAHWLSGSPRRARRAWRKSLAQAQRLGLPYEEALTHREIARHTKPGDPRREAHLARAREIFERLGAAGDLARHPGE